MSLFDQVMENYQKQRNQNVDIVDTPDKQSLQNLQLAEYIKKEHEKEPATGGDVAIEAVAGNTLQARIAKNQGENVDFVACAHDVNRSASNNNLTNKSSNSSCFSSSSRARKQQSQQIKCLGAECDDVLYEDVEGSPWLWCDHLDKAVIHLMECPQGHWQKDVKGFPLSNKELLTN